MDTEKIPFGLSFVEAIQTIGFLVTCVVVLLVAFALTLDKLNVKKFSIIPPCLEFYNDGDEKKSRITGRKKTVRRTARK